MTQLGRRALLQAGATMLGGAMLPASARAQENPGRRTYEFVVKDIVYQRGTKPRLARLYQPAGTGPFPAVLQVHGGAWNNKDRTDGQNTALDLAAAGIVVLSIDFRNAPEAPYPASLQDINYGIRWLKAHAGEFGSSSGQVGAYGTSSGGHQILLAAIRPEDPRYRALPLAEAPDLDARLAFVVSGWACFFRSSATSSPRPRAMRAWSRATTPSSLARKRRSRRRPPSSSSAARRFFCRPPWCSRAPRTPGPRSRSPSASPPPIGAPAAIWICCCWRAHPTPSSTNIPSTPTR